ncbi:MAG: sialate O-acetylesterase, partial [Bacteroidota bacterium]
MHRSIFLLLALALTTTDLAAQDLLVFESFTDHAVLQRDVDHPFWGWAKPRRRVTVQLGERELRTKAGADGRWQVSLPAMPAGGPHAITITAGRETIKLTDVYFGDVYLLSGQSNMEWRLNQSDLDGVRARAIADPLIRELKVKKSYAATPQDHLEIDPDYGTDWMTGTADEIGNFSGVGSYFAHYLREEVDVPIGLLHASWGGSRIEPWMSPKALGMDVSKLTADRDAILAAAGAEGKANFKKYFPGREFPKEDKGEAMGWLKEDFDDSAWPEMTLPTQWEVAGYPSVDGHFYFRGTFELTAAQAAEGAILHLGAIDDGDWTHVNGTLVGSTPNAYSELREYTIPANVLKAGQNVLAVRVYDNWGGGGFSATPSQFYLQT